MCIETSSEHECLATFGELATKDLSFEMDASTVLIQVRLVEI